MKDVVFLSQVHYNALIGIMHTFSKKINLEEHGGMINQDQCAEYWEKCKIGNSTVLGREILYMMLIAKCTVSASCVNILDGTSKPWGLTVVTGFTVRVDPALISEEDSSRKQKEPS
ncbi:Muskelin [Manis pentadactyla]|nr:Muskelin [Manis pentadactyla]